MIFNGANVKTVQMAPVTPPQPSRSTPTSSSGPTRLIAPATSLTKPSAPCRRTPQRPRAELCPQPPATPPPLVRAPEAPLCADVPHARRARDVVSNPPVGRFVPPRIAHVKLALQLRLVAYDGCGRSPRTGVGAPYVEPPLGSRYGPHARCRVSSGLSHRSYRFPSPRRLDSIRRHSRQTTPADRGRPRGLAHVHGDLLLAYPDPWLSAVAESRASNGVVPHRVEPLV